MRDLTIIYSGKQSEKTQIERFQKLNEIDIPGYFIEFFIRYEGCRVKENTFQDKYTLTRFLNLSSDRNASIEKIFSTYVEEECVKHWLPFAIDPGGWVFCLSLEQNTYGQVFVDRFDLGEENSFAFVAPSLEAFIDGLYSEK